MSLEIYYARPYQINEPESLQNIKINYVHRNIKSMYPKNIITSILYKHMQIFIPYTCVCIYELDYRCLDKTWGIATIYLDPLIKTHEKIKELEKDGYKFHEIDKLTISTYNSIKNLNPIFYTKYIPKPMIVTKILQQIDKNFDNFKHLVCEYNCIDLNRIRNCKNTNPITRYICYKLYS